MIVISFIIVLLSICLEGMITVFCSPISSSFLLISLLLLYPFFQNKKKIYLILLFISSVFYDILYTNVLFLSTICLFSVYLFAEKYLQTIKIFSVFGYFFLYHFLLFSLLYIIGYIKNPFLFIETIFYGSIPNLVYGFTLYFILRRFYPKKVQSYSYKSF